MHAPTTGKDIFENVSKYNMKLPWDKLVGLTTDGAPAMCGETSGLVGRMRVKMQEENCAAELTAYHCIIHQETLCGKVLKMEHMMSTVTDRKLYPSQGIKSPPISIFSARNGFRICRHSLSYRGALAELGKSSQQSF